MKKKSDYRETRIDPAPSRLSYLFHRVWLRKSFRLSILFSLQMSFICLLILSIHWKYDLNLFIKKNIAQLSEYIAFSPAFKVESISIISNNPLVVEKIKNNLAFNFPLSSLDIDVGTIKKQVENINFVQSASVRLTSDGSIEVKVEIRKPVALQRTGQQFFLLDASGAKVDEVTSRSDRLDLPLLVGKGAEYEVREALNLLLETKSLVVRVRGLVRIGERRWDIILDRNQTIKLPEENPIKAIKKILALQEGRRLLDRDILYLDFRNMSRPVLGLTEKVSKELREIRNLVRGENV
ncbi:MAG: hypothetical protein CML40_09010 [Rhodobacteraceae bacterium]|nr:MAG: hypothetical protein CML40_09010 [Paracoccaceae bacterium]